MKKKIYTLAVAMMMILPVFTFALANVALADANNMLWGGTEGNVQTTSGLGNSDPRAMAGSVIKILLGFLGIIAVVIILYGGFKWMTAAGNEDAVSQAKKMIGSGVIGLIVILAAFAIAQFVITALYNATGAAG
jgi:pyridoxal biosynthesis lyase PdxS